MEYPLHNNPAKLEKLFETIHKQQVPPKGTRDYFRVHGFTSSYDGAIPKLLAMLGFVDGKKIPTDTWRNFRGSQFKFVMADAIRHAYPDLFQTYSDPHQQDRNDLIYFFKIKTGYDESKVNLILNTFEKLCSLAEFSSKALPDGGTEETEEEDIDIGETKIAKRSDNGHYSINLNIQLQLPETNNPDVYDKLFESMKKHLFV